MADGCCGYIFFYSALGALQDEQSAESEQENHDKKRDFTLIISPVFIRAVNKATSASETPQHFAQISSELTSNSFLPNVTFAMFLANADTGAAVR
jgi:hypothetical protein